MNKKTILLTTKEVAKILSVSIITVKRWTKAGKIKAIVINTRGDMRFFTQDIEKFLEERQYE